MGIGAHGRQGVVDVRHRHHAGLNGDVGLALPERISGAIQLLVMTVRDLGDPIRPGEYHPSSAAWMEAINYGDAVPSRWTVGSRDVRYLRTITAISGSTTPPSSP